MDLLDPTIIDFVTTAKGPVVALAPGAAKPLGCWAPDNYASGALSLQSELGASVIILGDSADVRCCSFVFNLLDEKLTLDLAGNISCNKLLSLLSHIDLLCANDNWFLTAAMLSDVPSVGLCGPGGSARLWPSDVRHEIIMADLRCNPCYYECSFDIPFCMKNIAIDSVKSAIWAMLEKITVDALPERNAEIEYEKMLC